MNILVTGDSWACGAYTNEKESSAPDANFTHKPVQVLKPLLEQLSHNVIVKCNPGGNDIQTLKNIKKTLKSQSVDLIIYFKTSTLRSIGLSDIKKSGLKNAIKKFDDSLYSKLVNLQQRVFLIGALDKVPTDIKVEYVLSSLPETLLNVTFPKHIGGRDFFDNFKNWYNYVEVSVEDLELANVIMMNSVKAYRVLADNPSYFPDLGHPGEKSTKILLSIIKQEKPKTSNPSYGYQP